MYFDEKGRKMDKTALVKDITPLPNGYSGTIKVVRPQSHIEAEIAILSYDMDETETIFGQNLTAGTTPRTHGCVARESGRSLPVRCFVTMKTRAGQSRHREVRRIYWHVRTGAWDHHDRHVRRRPFVRATWRPS